MITFDFSSLDAIKAIMIAANAEPNDYPPEFRAAIYKFKALREYGKNIPFGQNELVNIRINQSDGMLDLPSRTIDDRISIAPPQ